MKLITKYNQIMNYSINGKPATFERYILNNLCQRRNRIEGFQKPTKSFLKEVTETAIYHESKF